MKTCIACKHFWFEPESGPYSSVTGGDPASFGCHAGKFAFIDWDDAQVNALTLANTCDSYELSELARSKGWTK